MVDKLTRDLTDQGKLIEAGFSSLMAMAYTGAPAHQVEELRNCFFAGAHHLFSSIMTMLDPGAEPTDDDFGRLQLIQRELDSFIQNYQLKRFPAQGRG